MTQSNTAPAGAAGRRPCADGTRTRAPRRPIPHLATVLSLGLAANLLIAESAIGPIDAIARAPAPSSIAAPPESAASAALPRAVVPLETIGEVDPFADPFAPARAVQVGLGVLGTRIAASEIRDRVGRVAAALPQAPDVIGSYARLLRRAFADQHRIVRYGDMRVARWIVGAVEVASARTGSDPVFMLALADKESSLRPGVGASTSSAEGLYQFIEQTWLQVVYQFGPDHGLADEAAAITKSADGRYRVEGEETRAAILALRRDPLISGLMAGEMLRRDRNRLEEALGRRLAPHEIYIAHFLGPAGAERFLTLKDEAPTTKASAEFAAAARANRAIFFARGKPRTIAEVDAAFETMIGNRVDRYVSVDPNSESARGRRLARLLASGAAEYASLKDAAAEAAAGEAVAEARESPRAAPVPVEAVVARVAGRRGETVPLPPRRPGES